MDRLRGGVHALLRTVGNSRRTGSASKFTNHREEPRAPSCKRVDSRTDHSKGRVGASLNRGVASRAVRHDNDLLQRQELGDPLDVGRYCTNTSKRCSGRIVEPIEEFRRRLEVEEDPLLRKQALHEVVVSLPILHAVVPHRILPRKIPSVRDAGFAENLARDLDERLILEDAAVRPPLEEPHPWHKADAELFPLVRARDALNLDRGDNALDDARRTSAHLH